ncbi:DUF1178 family protein, partial [Acinetobacter baumannii]
KKPLPQAPAGPDAVSAAAPKLPPQVVAALQAIAAVQAEALKSSTWVGDRFAEDVRAMHYGDKEEAPVHGRTSAEEARALL